MRLNLTAAVVAVGLCLSAAGIASTTVGSLQATTGTWRVYRGSGFTMPVCTASSEADAITCAAADAERRAATTRYQIRYPHRYVTITYAAAPPTPPAATWTRCAVEWQRCEFSGTRVVRYGSGSAWVERTLTGGTACTNDVFSDPAVGVTKECQLSSSDPPQPATGTAQLRWTPPTQNTDGTPLTDLAGYRIHYGTSSTALTQTVQIASPGATSYTIGNLASGTHHFAVRAYVSSGAESALSSIASKTVQ